LGETVGEALLRIHRSYLHIVQSILAKDLLHGISHITGGGIVGNTSRIIPEGLAMSIDWDAWEVPAIFKLIQKTGDIADEEMRHVYNMGIGMILIADKSDVNEILDMSKEYNPVIIGEIIKE